MQPAASIPPHVLKTFRHACDVFAFLIEPGERVTPLDWCERIEARYPPHHRRARVIAAIQACTLDAPAAVNETEERAMLKSYDFPNATIKVYADRKCREFPKWCLAINVERSRAYVADALRELRRYRRTQRAKA